MMDPDDVSPMTRDAVRQVEASKAYAARERGALMHLAVEVLADPTVSVYEQACARRRLSTRALDEADVSVLSAIELDTFEALLSKVIDGTTGDLDLRVVGEPRPYQPPHSCTCNALDYVNVADLDDVDREVVRDVIANLRHEQTKEATRLLGDAA